MYLIEETDWIPLHEHASVTQNDTVARIIKMHWYTEIDSEYLIPPSSPQLVVDGIVVVGEVDGFAGLEVLGDGEMCGEVVDGGS